MQTETKLKRIWRKITGLNEFGVLVPTIILVIVVQCINPVFLTYYNLTTVLRSAAYILLPALGMTMLMIAGAIDLSVGSVLGLGGCISALCMVNGINIFLSAVLGIAVGAFCGLINGFIIAKFHIPELMVTLGMYYMARGMVLIITGGTPIFPVPDSFNNIERSVVLGLPAIVVIGIFLAVVFFFILKYTTFGRKIYAIGGNVDTAKVSGIHVDRVIIAAYVITGTISAFAGVMMTGRLGSAQVSAGSGYELTAIAATVIGGTSTKGGKGSVIGTVFGAFFIYALTVSLTTMRISATWQDFVVGLVLIIAVIMDYIRNRKSFQ